MLAGFLIYKYTDLYRPQRLKKTFEVSNSKGNLANEGLLRDPIIALLKHTSKTYGELTSFLIQESFCKGTKAGITA